MARRFASMALHHMLGNALLEPQRLFLMSIESAISRFSAVSIVDAFAELAFLAESRRCERHGTKARAMPLCASFVCWRYSYFMLISGNEICNHMSIRVVKIIIICLQVIPIASPPSH